MKSLTFILAGIVIGAVLGSQGTIKAFTGGADESAQWKNRNTYTWHDDKGNPEYKIVVWNRAEI